MPLTPLLFLSPRVPWPLNTGAKIRTHALLDALKHHYRISYMGFLQPDLDEREAHRYLSKCVDTQLFPEAAQCLATKILLGLRTLVDRRPVTIAKYWNRSLADRVRRWMQDHPDGVVHADHLHMAPYLDLGRAALRVIDEHNVESRIVERLAEQKRSENRFGLAGFYFRLQARRMRAYESRMARRADLVLAVSTPDAEELTRMAPQTPIECIPNGVDVDYFSANHGGGLAPLPGRMVFTGSMNWLPNQDAVSYFVDEILPVLNERHGRPFEWTLDVVGHAPPPSIQALSSDRVRVTGSVDDVRPYLREASVCVVPLRIGGGSRLKILEAFAMGLPVVSTSVGCEGLEVEHERHLLVADEPHDIAQAVARTEGDESVREELATRARGLAHESYSWTQIGRRMVERYAVALGKT